ncbi:MAG: penicillin-binding transpeptidase domain-containing protein [Bacteroidales bacterium]
MSGRRYVIIGILIIIILTYAVRLFDLQIVETKYKSSADSNAFFKKIIYPTRGQIFDRNGELVVYNQPAYDLMLVFKNITEFDTLDLCKSLGITTADYHTRVADIKNRAKNPGYSYYTPQTFMTHLSIEDYGRLQEKLYRYPGFFIQKRVLRDYNYSVGANFLGNIREVNINDIKRDDYYTTGDYTGDLGIEKSYELILRGEKGMEIYMRDAHGRIQGRHEDGAFDIEPVAGSDMKLSIDIKLQEYGEKLMANKIGAIVAIEPSTGEILALVSSPTYDPRLLVGKDRGLNYKSLVSDRYKPFFDRAIMGAYPPGSTFKIPQSLILQQEEIITKNSYYPCHNGYVSGRFKLGCHAHSSPVDLVGAITTSCNAYYCWGMKDMLDNSKDKYGGTISEAFEVWKNHIVNMGFGYKLGIDLPGESRGFIPNSKFYGKYYGENRWRANTIISISIGQGEILSTPLQVANMCAMVANRGYFITPHVVKEIADTLIDEQYRTKKSVGVKYEYFEPVIQGMRNAVTEGTCLLANLPNVEVCGKTGTAQNPHGKDHSAFIGFAPMDSPKIAICVYVENAGFGATYGVPIGSLMIEKYLNGEIAEDRKYLEDRMINANTIIYSGVKIH